MRAEAGDPPSTARISAEQQDTALFSYGHDLLRLLERLHRRYLDVVRIELERLEVTRIAPVQGLMLLTIGDASISLRDLVAQGYYLGANAASNMKALVDAGFVETEGEVDGNRVRVQVRLTAAGAALRDKLRKLEMAHIDGLAFGAKAMDDLWATYRTLHRLERTWADVIRSDVLDIE